MADEAQKLSLESEMDKIWEKAQEEGINEAPAEPEASEDVEEKEIPQKEEKPDEPEEPKEQPKEDKLPGELPKAFREKWESYDEETRESILTGHREMNRKLSEQGRQVHGIKPIRDVLVQAVQEMPQLAQMQPEQVAREVFELARMSAQFKEKPLETMLGLVNKHGMADAMRQHLTGQPAQQQAAVAKEIRDLKAELARVKDPQYVRQQSENVFSEREMFATVNQFAAGKERWAEVEPYMPQAIQFMQAKHGTGADPNTILEGAYELAASQFLPDYKAHSTASAIAASASADPERAAIANKAKSVNVRSNAASKPREKTTRELMDDVWAKHHS